LGLKFKAKFISKFKVNDQYYVLSLPFKDMLCDKGLWIILPVKF